MNTFFKAHIIAAVLLIGSAGVSCKKMLDLKPENLTLAADALKTTADAQALLNSCYDEFANLMNGSVQNIHELLGENLAQPQNSAGSLYYTVWNRGTFSFRTADREYLDFYNCILRMPLFAAYPAPAVQQGGLNPQVVGWTKKKMIKAGVGFLVSMGTVAAFLIWVDSQKATGGE